MANKRVRIADLSHRLVLCTSRDVVDENNVLTLARQDVVKVWACVIAKKSSMFSRSGAVIKDELSQRTHVITIRKITSIDISSAAWLYEERLVSSPRWFKIIGVEEDDTEGFYYLDCRIHERGDSVSAPAALPADPVIATLPQGVML